MSQPSSEQIESARLTPNNSTRKWFLSNQGLGWLFIIMGTLGLFASVRLTMDKIRLLEDPNASLFCDISPFISCQDVMNSWQGSLVGIPNSLFGIIAFSVVITFGVALLSGAQLPRLFWQGMQIGSTLAFVFITWLMTQSLYDIKALCIYCILVWAVTTPIFWYSTLRNMAFNVWRSESDSAKSRPRATRGGWLLDFHAIPLVVWYIVIIMLIFFAFLDLWITLF